MVMVYEFRSHGFLWHFSQAVNITKVMILFPDLCTQQGPSTSVCQQGWCLCNNTRSSTDRTPLGLLTIQRICRLKQYQHIAYSVILFFRNRVNGSLRKYLQMATVNSVILTNSLHKRIVNLTVLKVFDKIPLLVLTQYLQKTFVNRMSKLKLKPLDRIMICHL